MKIAITGVTGLLGSNLLVEIIQYFKNDLKNVGLILFGRNDENDTFANRIFNIIDCDYRDIFEIEQKECIDHFLNENIRYIDINLCRRDLGLKNEDFEYLKKIKIDIFYHCGACTDFRNSSKVTKKLDEINIEGTKAILQLTKSLKVDQFCYVGSAYSCGLKTGNVLPDYITPDLNFRNYYEYSKLMAELEVRKFEKECSTRFKYYRTSTICGRLIDSPIGFINKFDVFYAWAAFFLRIKMKKIINCDEIYNVPLELPMRINFNPNSGLNIVPVDYIAKMMLVTSVEECNEKNYHIVNMRETPHSLYISLMLRAINICGIKFLETMPEDKNEIENFYYKTVGAIYTPYITSDPINFQCDNIRDISEKNNIFCPLVDEVNFNLLMDFAKKKCFGLIDDTKMHMEKCLS